MLVEERMEENRMVKRGKYRSLTIPTFLVEQGTFLHLLIKESNFVSE